MSAHKSCRSIGPSCALVCLLCLFVAKGSMGILEELHAKLSETRGGRTLGGGVVKILVKYMVEVMVYVDVNECDLKDLPTVAAEAWPNLMEEALLPALTARDIKDWVIAKPLPMLPGSTRSIDGGDDLEDEADDSQLLCTETPNARDLMLLEKDKAAQGLSGARLIALSLAAELGRVPPIGNVVGFYAYKGCAQLSEMAKKQRKAGMQTLSQILEGKNVRRELETHFGNLIRDLSEMGSIQEASLLSRFWGEAQSISTDDKTLASYIREYFRKYSGRGIPEVIDVILATRVTGQREMGGGLSDEKLKEVAAIAKKATNEVADLRREISSLKSEIRRNGKGPVGGDKEPRGPQCHKCGEFGHIARNCTGKDKKAPSDDEDAKGSDE